MANSAWTARELARRHDITARVVYPPVTDPGPGLSWAARTNTFLCVGRFHGSKRFELAATILARLRVEVPDVRLHIVGSNVDTRYTRRLQAMAHRDAEWITISEDLSQRELFDVMGRCRYGIHAMEGEHFGIAAAEMARGFGALLRARRLTVRLTEGSVIRTGERWQLSKSGGVQPRWRRDGRELFYLDLQGSWDSRGSDSSFRG